MKILIAEDDFTSRSILTAILKKWGYEVVSASDGNEAWEVLQGSDVPKLAILDWMMPGMDGIELCHKLRKLDSMDPVYTILLTSRGDKSDIVRGLEAGANDYIAKPYHNEELRARVGVGRRMVELQTQLIAAEEELRHMAMHDALTGAPNRRSILSSLNKEIDRSTRENSLLCVALCDIDHFKRVNDTYGHQTGDDVLKDIVRRFRTTLRPYDHIGRYGGEEFLVILPYRNSGGENAFERLRAAISSPPFSTRAGDIPVTVSIGVVSANGSTGSDSLLMAADEALYKAKDGGRNRVVFNRLSED